MAAKSLYLQNAILNHVLRNSTFAMPSALYLALHTVAPTENTNGTEVSGGGYARTSLTFATAATGQTSNSANVDFPTATASWGTIEGFAIYDASTAGHILFFGTYDVSQLVSTGYIVTIPAGDLVINET